MKNCQAQKDASNCPKIDLTVLDVLYYEILQTIEGSTQEKISEKEFLLRRLRRATAKTNMV